MPWLTGTAQWIFKDFSTPVRPGNPIPYVNRKRIGAKGSYKKRRLLCFSILLGYQTHGTYLWAFMAGALGR